MYIYVKTKCKVNDNREEVYNDKANPLCAHPSSFDIGCGIIRPRK